MGGYFGNQPLADIQRSRQKIQGVNDEELRDRDAHKSHDDGFGIAENIVVINSRLKETIKEKDDQQGNARGLKDVQNACYRALHVAALKCGWRHGE